MIKYIPSVALACVTIMTGCPPAWGEPIEGVVLPSKQVVLNAPLPSIVKTIVVEEGDRIEAQQALVLMDDGLQQVAVRSAELQANSTTAVRNAELVLEDALIQVERILEAQASDAASEWEVRRTRLQAEQAAAQVEQAKEQQELARVQLELERERLKRFTVLAPFIGRVLRVEAEAGASLTQQDPLLVLVSLHPLEANFHLPAEAYGRLATGQAFVLRTQNPEAPTVAAIVKTIDPVIDPASQTFRVVLEIDNADETLPSGFPVWLDLDLSSGNGVAAVGP